MWHVPCLVHDKYSGYMWLSGTAKHGSIKFVQVPAEVLSEVGGFHSHGGTPKKWLVYKGKSHLDMDDLGLPP